MKEISLMFSGGLDSTYAAIELAKKYDKVHLLTYSNGYGHYMMGKSKRRFKELKKLFPGKFMFHFTSIKSLFERILIDSLKEDSRKYSSGFIWCLGCKLSMHAQTILFNKRNNIKEAADGSSQDTSEMVEQSPFSLAMIKDIYSSNKIKFYNPVYNITRSEKRNALKMVGLNLGIQIFDRHLGIQPKCIPGELYYSPLVIMGNSPHHPTKEISMFYREKIPIITNYIKENL